MKTENDSILRRVFQLDLRSLALMRVGIGVVLLLDLATRARDLVGLYTDAGVLPREAALHYALNAYEWSIHTAGGSAVFEILLFALAAVFALALILGYRTRIATIACWVLLASLYARNTIIGNVGDMILRHALFFGMFLPLGARFSIDAARNPPAAKAQNRFRSAAVVGLLAQIAYIYYFAAIHKADPVWIREGTGLYYALSIDQLVTPLGVWALQFPGFLKVLSFGTIILEVFGPLLLFSPVATERARIVAVFAFVTFHLGTGLLQHLGLVPLASMCIWLAIIPTHAWENSLARFADRLRRGVERLYRELSAVQRVLPPAAVGATPAELRPSRVTTVFLGAVIVFLFFWNVSTLRQVEGRFAMPAPLANAGIFLRLEQGWTMFSPHPLTSGGWPVLAGQLADGTQVDLGTNRPVDFAKPERWPRPFASGRWRSYFTALWHRADEFGAAFDELPEYLCRTWNASHPASRQVLHVDVYRVREFTTLPEEPPIDPQTILLYSHDCGDREIVRLDRTGG